MRGQLERGAEPIDPDFYARWLKSKGSMDEAETCIRAHAAWREAFVTSGRIQEVVPTSLSIKVEFSRSSRKLRSVVVNFKGLTCPSMSTEVNLQHGCVVRTYSQATW